MNYVISKFKNNNDLLSILIILLPIWIIIGNLAINLSCLLIIILGVKKFNQKFPSNYYTTSWKKAWPNCKKRYFFF